ncbi:MAG TPA: PQQ-binding-like beta-propeller repeat protein [Novosphingobium sp.]|nr:PQQ-binding-like beta-propeller repeat protein [Novosphingobium sp.]
MPGTPGAALAQDTHDGAWMHSSAPPADAYRDPGARLDAAVQAKGKEVYQTICSGCHEQGLNRAPQKYIIAQLTPEAVYHALTAGVMQPMAASLDDGQKRAVAQYVTHQALGTHTAPPPRMCAPKANWFDDRAPPAFAGWGLDLANTHREADELAGIDRANVGKLHLKWAIGFPGALRARSQPAIAGGAIFVGSHDGSVYALDAETGCARWIFHARGEVRTAPVVAPWTPGGHGAHPLVYFSDLVGNVYALDATTGTRVWSLHADDHPSTTLTATPALYRDTLYIPVSSLEEGAAASPGYSCCTFRGSLLAVDARTGATRWRTYFTDKPQPRGLNADGVQVFGPSGVAIWNTPAIDPARGLLYLDTGDNYSDPVTPMSDAIVAMDLGTGAIRWSYQARAGDVWNGSCEDRDTANCPAQKGPDYDFGAGVVLARGVGGHDYLLAGQKSGTAYALDPDTGRLVWQAQIGRGGVVGGIHFGMATSNGLLYVPISDAPDGRTYAEPPHPGLFALDVATGARVWQAPAPAGVCGDRPLCHPGYSAAITATSQLVLAGSNDGHLRIFDAASGAVLWDADTTGPVATVSGQPAHGGSMSGGAAPIAWHGLLLVETGYGFAGKMPGNAMLVYGVR